MSSSARGMSTSKTEVTNISAHGFWLLSHDQEFFLSFQDFPWFKNAPIGHVTEVKEVSPGHYYWPQLDVDLGIEAIKKPENFPLIAKG